MNATDAKAKYLEVCKIVEETEKLVIEANHNMWAARAEAKKIGDLYESNLVWRRFAEDEWMMAEQVEYYDKFKDDTINPPKPPVANEFRRTLLR